MKKAGDKLHSQHGATLMLALLLFLICAVLGSVVLVAGTAAAGRLSELAKMEQRYYAVTSAANLLREKLCAEDGVEVVCTKETKSVRTITYQADGTTSLGPSSIQSVEYVWPSDLASDTLETRLARYVVLGFPKGSDDEQKWGLCTGASDLAATNLPTVPAIQLIPDITTPAAADGGLTVNVETTMHADRTVTLAISNEKEKEKAAYTLTMTLSPVLERKKSETVNAAVSGTTETTITTEVCTVRVCWQVSSIQTRETTTAGGGSGA